MKSNEHSLTIVPFLWPRQHQVTKLLALSGDGEQLSPRHATMTALKQMLQKCLAEAEKTLQSGNNTKSESKSVKRTGKGKVCNEEAN